jgi:hypothetical protein
MSLASPLASALAFLGVPLGVPFGVALGVPFGVALGVPFGVALGVPFTDPLILALGVSADPFGTASPAETEVALDAATDFGSTESSEPVEATELVEGCGDGDSRVSGTRRGPEGGGEGEREVIATLWTLAPTAMARCPTKGVNSREPM